MSIIIACPVGGGMDHVEQVTAVVSSERDRLRQRLARPEMPQRPARATYLATTQSVDEAEEEYQAALRTWETSVIEIVMAQELWASRLYYCHVHDIVFLAGDTRSVPPERMLEVLTDTPELPPAPALAMPNEQIDTPATAGTPPEETPAAWEYCEITAHASMGLVTFSAQAIGPAGSYTAATLQPIRDATANEDRITQHAPAVGELVLRLEADGWQPIEARGAYWYSRRFRRRLGDRAVPAGASEHWSTIAEAISEMLTHPGALLPESVARLAPAARAWVITNLAGGHAETYERAADAVRRTARFLADSAATALGYAPSRGGHDAPPTIIVGPASSTTQGQPAEHTHLENQAPAANVPTPQASESAVDAEGEIIGGRQPTSPGQMGSGALDRLKVGVSAVAVDHTAHLAERQRASLYGGHLNISAGLRVRMFTQRLLRPIIILLEMLPGPELYGPGDIITAIEALMGMTLDGLKLSIFERIIYGAASAIPVVPARPAVGFYRRVEPWLRSENTLSQRAATASKLASASGLLAGAGWAFLQSQLPPWLRVALPDPRDPRYPRSTNHKVIRTLAGLIWLPFVTYFTITTIIAAGIVTQSPLHLAALTQSDNLAHIFLLDRLLSPTQALPPAIWFMVLAVVLAFIAALTVTTIAHHDRLREAVIVAARYHLHLAHGELVGRVNDTLWRREPPVSAKLAESAQHLRDISLKAARSMMVRVLGEQALQLAISLTLAIAAIAVGVVLVVLLHLG